MPLIEARGDARVNASANAALTADAECLTRAEAMCGAGNAHKSVGRAASGPAAVETSPPRVARAHAVSAADAVPAAVNRAPTPRTLWS